MNIIYACKYSIISRTSYLLYYLYNSHFIGPVSGNEQVYTNKNTYDLGDKHKIIPRKRNKIF